MLNIELVLQAVCAEWAFQERCPSIANCVLFANAGDVAPTAIVVPRQGDVAPATIVDEMRSAASEGRLRSWEIPGRVLLDPGPWEKEARLWFVAVEGGRSFFTNYPSYAYS